ncbi:MAG: hypothetical protein H6741_04740 [Alphaproteobacteria bacterium]|nr:hypothetical protein [Alphaproteobacteria bacterium]MCB9792015.1 hypothetical protein [Alphaproteobacteria bacterium]
MNCWNCNEPCEGRVCPGCGALQPPPPKPDLFAILGLARRYHLDRAEVDRAWRQASRETHPDRFAGQAAVMRRMSLQWTASLNEARRVLRDPVRRAWYLATGEPRPPERGGPTLSQDFLEQVFELRMELAEDPESVRGRIEALRASLDADLEGLFTAWEEGEGALDAIPERLSRLKYIDNMIAELPASA